MTVPLGPTTVQRAAISAVQRPTVKRLRNRTALPPPVWFCRFLFGPNVPVTVFHRDLSRHPFSNSPKALTLGPASASQHNNTAGTFFSGELACVYRRFQGEIAYETVCVQEMAGTGSPTHSCRGEAMRALGSRHVHRDEPFQGSAGRAVRI